MTYKHSLIITFDNHDLKGWMAANQIFYAMLCLPTIAWRCLWVSDSEFTKRFPHNSDWKEEEFAGCEMVLINQVAIVIFVTFLIAMLIFRWCK